MVKVFAVIPNSSAYKAGILPSDILLSVNGKDICDVLDYKFYTTEKKLSLKLLRNENELSVNITKKDEYDDIGLEFETYLMDEKQSCKNGCIFCFIDQNPKGMRESIYFKDDDSRLSFFFGNYVTLTNFTDYDVERIIKMRISPINISVHTTNPELRIKMMRNKKAGNCLKYLKAFYDGEILMNCQIVLCKGINDGGELKRTLTELSDMHEWVDSIAVVPSGLTCHREGLFKLEPFSQNDSLEVISIIDQIANKNLSSFGKRLIYASDEWYLKAKCELPDEEYYEGYPQIENGVGMLRSMGSEIDNEIDFLHSDGFSLSSERHVSIATGKASYDFICKIVEKLQKAWYNFKCDVYLAENRFYGGSVTVSGLLTGSDLLFALSGKELFSKLFISSSMLRHEQDIFLDNMTLSELSQILGVEICPLNNDGAEFVCKLLGINE